MKKILIALSLVFIGGVAFAQTATQTASTTPTGTFTQTPTTTRTPIFTRTPFPTATSIYTNTYTKTATVPSYTSTQTKTRTATQTASNTPSKTATQTASQTPTQTSTPTYTATETTNLASTDTFGVQICVTTTAGTCNVNISEGTGSWNQYLALFTPSSLPAQGVRIIPVKYSGHVIVKVMDTLNRPVNCFVNNVCGDLYLYRKNNWTH